LATVIVNPNGANPSQAIGLENASFLVDGQIISQDQKKWNDTGIYVFEPKVLDYIPLRTHFDIHTQLMPAMLANGAPIIGCELQGYWNDLDTFPKYHEAQKAILHSVWEKPAASGGIPSVRYPLLQGREVSEGIWIGRNNRIHPDARLIPPVYIGDNCWIDRAVELGPETFIGSQVIVDSEASISHSTILDHTYVGKLVNIEHRLVHNSSIIDLVTGNQIQVVDPHLLSQTRQLNVRGGSKRIFDFSIAMLLFVLWLPVILVLAILLKITGGRVFDRVNHIRPGETNAGPSRKPYPLLRFHIPAKSRTNRLLRYCLTHLEGYRLPELWNVIVGDLGLVGVKPLSVEEAGKITEAWQKKPYDYSPGITGLWYVDTRPDSKTDAFMIADAYYTVTRSWKEDLRLLLRTPYAWLKRVQKQEERS
jgi:lipopolysaccharide/colanic/teichoic acid biosynthesis glycosyltransferase